MRGFVKKAFASATAAAMAVTMCVPARALAADATVGTTFAQDGCTYKITAVGEVSFGNGIEDSVDVKVAGSDINIPQTVSYQGSTYTVTSIAAKAFYKDAAITSVSVPSTVKTISQLAFYGCGTMDESGSSPTYSGLEHVYLEDGSQLRIIGEEAFANCYNLESFTIPATVYSIAKRAFVNCFSFKTLEFEEGTTISLLEESSFGVDWQAGFAKPKEWDSTVSSKYTYDDFGDDDYADWDWAGTIAESKQYGGLESATIPATVKRIGWSCFANQRSLKSLTFEANTMEYINYFAFAFCSSLEELEIPGTGYISTGYTTYEMGYGDECFIGCNSLRKVTFKGEVKGTDDPWIGCHMFDNCTSLSEVVFLETKFTPLKYYYRFSRTHGDSSYYYEYGYNNSSPSEYVKVGFTKDAQEAQLGGSSLGWAILRTDATPLQVKEGMAVSDEKGAIVLEGGVAPLPEGYDAWSFVAKSNKRELSANSYIDDICFAFPVKATDLSRGAINLSAQSFIYDESAHVPQTSVVNAVGEVLGSSDYTLSWERMGADGNWSVTTDFTSAGTLRALATGKGTYSGTTSAQFNISYLEEGAVLSAGGITYTVSSVSDSGQAQLQVGDGESLAVDLETDGEVVIPESVELEGSSMKIPVTGIGAHAFGSTAEDEACANITEVTLPEGIETIGDYAFANMTSLVAIQLPASLKAIGTGAFSHCTALSEVTFAGASLERIGTSAFGYCTRLHSLELPTVTESFLGLAFENCVMLDSVVFKGDVNGNRLGQFNGCERLVTVKYDGNYWDYQWFTGTKVTAAAGSGVAKAVYAYVSGEAKAIYTSCSATGVKATVSAKVTFGSKAYAVSGIAASAFKGSKVKTLTVASTTLTKATVKNCLKDSKVTTVKVPAKKKAAYKKIFTKANCGKAVTIK